MAETPLSAQPGDVRSFPHQMLREIYQQPGTIRETIRLNVEGDVLFPEMLNPIENALLAFKKIIIAASGSSRHAGLVGEIIDRKSTRLNSSHRPLSRMPSSA